MTRDAARRLAARTSAGLAGATLAVLGLLAWRQEYALARELWLIRSSGYVALAALFLALSVSPLQALVRSLGGGRGSAPAAAAFRRAFGITAACTALLHAGLALGTYLGDAWFAALARPAFRSGLLALLILVALLVTSFPTLVRRLHIGLWKELHWLAFAAAALVLQHLLLSAFAPRATVLALFGGLALLGALRLLPARSPGATRSGPGPSGSGAPR